LEEGREHPVMDPGLSNGRWVGCFDWQGIIKDGALRGWSGSFWARVIQPLNVTLRGTIPGILSTSDKSRRIKPEIADQDKKRAWSLPSQRVNHAHHFC